MDILNLDVAALAAQYLEFVQRHINDISIDDASEYLLMATYLLELKSKKVLPVENLMVGNSNFELERDRLVHRIIEYRKYKDAIPQLLTNQNKRLEMYAKQADDLEAYVPEETIMAELPQAIDPSRLMKAMEKAFEKWKLSLFTHHKILVQELSVDDVEKEIINYLNTHDFQQISFSDYLKSIDELKLSQQYIVTCFSALLELVKYRKINLTQSDLEDDIFFAKTLPSDEARDLL